MAKKTELTTEAQALRGVALAALEYVARGGASVRDADRIRAAEIILERGYGKVPQETKETGDSETAHSISLTIAGPPDAD